LQDFTATLANQDETWPKTTGFIRREFFRSISGIIFLQRKLPLNSKGKTDILNS